MRVTSESGANTETGNRSSTSTSSSLNNDCIGSDSGNCVASGFNAANNSSKRVTTVTAEPVLADVASVPDAAVVPAIVKLKHTRYSFGIADSSNSDGGNSNMSASTFNNANTKNDPKPSKKLMPFFRRVNVDPSSNVTAAAATTDEPTSGATAPEVACIKSNESSSLSHLFGNNQSGAEDVSEVADKVSTRAICRAMANSADNCCSSDTQSVSLVQAGLLRIRTAAATTLATLTNNTATAASKSLRVTVGEQNDANYASGISSKRTNARVNNGIVEFPSPPALTHTRSATGRGNAYIAATTAHLPLNVCRATSTSRATGTANESTSAADARSSVWWWPLRWIGIGLERSSEGYYY